MKKLIAYSSIAHMASSRSRLFVPFVTWQLTGAADGAILGMEGGMVQMISHGSFPARSSLRRRPVRPPAQPRHRRLRRRREHDAGLRLAHGAVRTRERGLPARRASSANSWSSSAASTRVSGSRRWPRRTLVLGAAYTLWLVKRVIFGPVANDVWRG
jgi:NADH-quinone oxidoreductase subunit M